MLRLKVLPFRNSTRLIYAVRCSSQYQSFEPQGNNLKYEGHRPISNFQKGLLAVSSAVTSLIDPYRGDMVAALGETTSYKVLRKLQLSMLNDPVGRQILEEKPIVDSETCVIKDLLLLPKNTFGYAYANFMDSNGLSSDTRSFVHYIDNAELAYIMKRYRQIHDYVHVLLDFNVNVPDEIVVKWFEFAHFGLPMTALSAFFGPLNTSTEDKKYIANNIPWAIQNGYNSRLMLNVYFENEFEKDFASLKRELRINPKPEFFE